MRRRSFKGAVTIMALTTAALIGTAGSAFACVPGDDRATGTVGNATKCEQIGLGKAIDVSGDLTVTGGTQQDQYLTVTKVAEGVKVAAIVVKGGNEFNTYVPGKKGLSNTPPWEKLHAPMVGRDFRNVPTISHWFACGSKDETKPPVETKPTKPTETAKPTQTTSAPSTSDTATTTKAAPAGNEAGGSGGGLANTGFDNSFLIWVGGLLLLAGGGLLALLKFRRKASE